MKQTLKIKGMHCKSCKMLLEDALEDINVKVDVNYDLGTAEVEFDESKTSLEKIKETIKAEGDYQVE
ncbi:heavy-metal-associated domain-containing protein [Candidatus Woesearchaeota archaeon]|jgi:copper chaperone|nr:heavy-metal-associated domain-containing protein [Candidatus Woesearchaeota archaeon]MBT4151117.1 heavy-metal-associated domain-containing protein [Candidatus Woesearchaeota archaeon]MBT4247935.1 heavy-metal-associated domain-containing protein [Candidatus Woesearchaeota archaeon]MBT4433926.1 heavy-metal-associated domain-containing protein [Candidatus Woesearchaeota archaeon]MBT7332031.1 heavy-metal-associated domain-containing protein [Candidatus Woesearchaeota archaeon]